MIENLRKELAGGKSLPVVFSQLDTKTACVTTEGLKGEGMFFFTEGYRGLGERYAKEIIGLLKASQ